MSHKKNHRKSKYVNSFLQGNLMLRMVMYWAIYNVALLSAMVGESLMRVVPEILDGTRAYALPQFVAEFTTHHSSMLLAMSVLCPILIWDMLRYSNRIAGPLYRFRKALRDHIDGQPLQPVKLREGDLLIEFQDTWNEFVQYKRMRDQSPNRTAVEAAAQISAERQSSPSTASVQPITSQFKSSSR